MSDALNMIALAKMAVIVIGIFLVPVITRKFAADLGAPVGQMAVNRAAVASLGMGLVGTKVAWASTQGIRSSGTASILSPLGSRIKGVATKLQKNENFEAQSSSSSGRVSTKVGSKLEKFGQYLEEASIRHEARKSGIEPPSLTDKVKKTLSADPKITGPILAKEQQYKSFVASRSANAFPSALAAANAIHEKPTPSNSYGPASVPFSSPAYSSSNPISTNPVVTVATKNPGAHGAPVQGRNTGRLNTSAPSSTNPKTAAPDKSFTERVQKFSHRWTRSNRINRLFESSEERKPS